MYVIEPFPTFRVCLKLPIFLSIVLVLLWFVYTLRRPCDKRLNTALLTPVVCLFPDFVTSLNSISTCRFLAAASTNVWRMCCGTIDCTWLLPTPDEPPTGDFLFGELLAFFIPSKSFGYTGFLMASQTPLAVFIAFGWSFSLLYIFGWNRSGRIANSTIAPDFSNDLFATVLGNLCMIASPDASVRVTVFELTLEIVRFAVRIIPTRFTFAESGVNE